MQQDDRETPGPPPERTPGSEHIARPAPSEGAAPPSDTPPRREVTILAGDLQPGDYAVKSLKQGLGAIVKTIDEDPDPAFIAFTMADGGQGRLRRTEHITVAARDVAAFPPNSFRDPADDGFRAAATVIVTDLYGVDDTKADTQPREELIAEVMTVLDAGWVYDRRHSHEQQSLCFTDGNRVSKLQGILDEIRPAQPETITPIATEGDPRDFEAEASRIVLNHYGTPTEDQVERRKVILAGTERLLRAGWVFNESLSAAQRDPAFDNPQGTITYLFDVALSALDSIDGVPTSVPTEGGLPIHFHKPDEECDESCPEILSIEDRALAASEYAPGQSALTREVAEVVVAAFYDTQLSEGEVFDTKFGFGREAIVNVIDQVIAGGWQTDWDRTRELGVLHFAKDGESVTASEVIVKLNRRSKVTLETMSAAWEEGAKPTMVFYDEIEAMAKDDQRDKIVLVLDDPPRELETWRDTFQQFRDADLVIVRAKPAQVIKDRYGATPRELTEEDERILADHDAVISLAEPKTAWSSGPDVVSDHGFVKIDSLATEAMRGDTQTMTAGELRYALPFTGQETGAPVTIKLVDGHVVKVKSITRTDGIVILTPVDDLQVVLPLDIRGFDPKDTSS